MFFTTATLSKCKQIQASAEEVLAVVQNVAKLAMFDPVVHAITPSGDIANEWIITERTTVMGCIPYRTTAVVVAATRQDGVKLLIQPGLGVEQKIVWSVKSLGPNECFVMEEVDIEAPFLLMPLVRNRCNEAQDSIIDRLTETLERRAKPAPVL